MPNIHRNRIEITERGLVSELQGLYTYHRARLAQQKPPAKPISLGEFSIQVLRFGLSAMRLVLEHKDTPEWPHTYEQKGMPNAEM